MSETSHLPSTACTASSSGPPELRRDAVHVVAVCGVARVCQVHSGLLALAAMKTPPAAAVSGAAAAEATAAAEPAT